MEEKYYCQTAIQNILDHIVPVPDDFDVAPQYLYDCDKDTYVKGFKRFREIIIRIFMNMQEHPEEYTHPVTCSRYFAADFSNLNTGISLGFHIQNYPLVAG